MMWWVPVAIAHGLPPLPRAGEIPELRWYAQVDEEDGRLAGRWRRRRDGEHELSVLADGLVVRWRHTQGPVVVDRQRDAAGRPLVTVRWDAGVPAVVTPHGLADQDLQVTGWGWVALPGGGAAWLPAGATTSDARASGPLLGGQWAAERAPRTDPWAPAFAEGLLDGCACALFDRGTVWIDGQPAARHAVLVAPGATLPDQAPPDLVEVWALPRADHLLVLTWRAPAPPDPLAASLRARALPALVDLDPAGGGP
jgi:hypothetical protein